MRYTRPVCAAGTMTWCKAGAYTISSKPIPSSPPVRGTATALIGFSSCRGALDFPSSLLAVPANPSGNASETIRTKLFFILRLLIQAAVRGLLHPRAQLVRARTLRNYELASGARSHDSQHRFSTDILKG